MLEKLRQDSSVGKSNATTCAGGLLPSSGLIVSSVDNYSGIQWGCGETPNNISNATSLTDGSLNTSRIMSFCSTRPIAASVCGNLIRNSRSDWYLPALNQLNTLYNNRAALGISGAYYWSSTEVSPNPDTLWLGSTHAWVRYFGADYSPNPYGKSSTVPRVRCVRTL